MLAARVDVGGATEPREASGLRAERATRGVFTDRGPFVRALAPPVDDRLARMLGSDPKRAIVYVAQQVCADYSASVVAKFAAARDLASGDGPAVVILWHDMDRVASDRLAMRFVVPLGAKRLGIWLAPRACKHREPRFIEVERARLDAAVAELSDWLARVLPRSDREEPDARLERLASALTTERVETLADANRALSSFLLSERLGFAAPSAFVSELAGAGLLTDPLNALLARLDDVVAVFNAALDELRAAGLDAGVQPLDDGYLPVRYSCARGGRIRLTRVADGARQLAVGRCRCGAEHRFDLGAGVPSLGELEPTGRWSPDLTVPVLLNDLASGVVAGRSSGRYGLVLNEIVARVLGARPIPMLLPAGLDPWEGWPEGAKEGEATSAPDSLLCEYLLR